MTLDAMVTYAPVNIYRRPDGFHCNWSPQMPSGARVNGRACAETAYMAVARAYRDAIGQGWKAPE